MRGAGSVQQPMVGHFYRGSTSILSNMSFEPGTSYCVNRCLLPHCGLGNVFLQLSFCIAILRANFAGIVVSEALNNGDLNMVQQHM